MSETPTSPVLHLLWPVWRRVRYVVVTVVRQFVQDGCLQSAAALTFTTMFAIVPLMTVTYSALSILPSFADVGSTIEGFVFDNFVPASGTVVRDYLTEFSEKSRNLTILGGVLLVVTAVLLIVNIERAFNQIWRAQAQRGLQRMLSYWSVLTIGPPAVAATLSITTYLASLPLLDEVIGPTGIQEYLLQLLPLLFSGSAFTILFFAVPNYPVRFVHALLGGFLTMLAFHFAIRLFAVVVAQGNYEVTYGAFAALPALLMWIYLCWAIVLTGAVFVKVLAEDVPDDTAEEPPILAGVIKALALLSAAQRQGGSVSPKEIAAVWPGADAEREAVLGKLRVAGLVERTDAGAWLLARDAGTISLWDALRHSGEDLVATDLQRLGHHLPEAAHKLADARAKAQAALAEPIAPS